MLSVLILTLTIQLLINECKGQASCAAILCVTNTDCVDCVPRVECQPSCDNPRGRTGPNCRPRRCSAGCVCRAGYMLSNDRTTCIQQRNCLRNTQGFLSWLQQLRERIIGSGNSNGGSTGEVSTELLCGANEQVYGCGYCPRSCANPDLGCTKECRDPECGCISGFLRDDSRGNLCLNATSAACQALNTETGE